MIIIISIDFGPFNQRNNTAGPFSRLSLPVLDLLGEQDLEGVIRGAGVRAAFDHGFDYTQVKVDGANHFFDGHETELIAVVSGWLNQKLAQ